jgi:hypothetical protein
MGWATSTFCLLYNTVLFTISSHILPSKYTPLTFEASSKSLFFFTLRYGALGDSHFVHYYSKLLLFCVGKLSEYLHPIDVKSVFSIHEGKLHVCVRL